MKKFWVTPRNLDQFMDSFACAFSVRMWGAVLGAVAIAAAPFFAFATTAGSPTLASTSLCGDGYVLALAPEQVTTLSWQSRSALSRATDTQKKYPQIWNDAESLAKSKADIIVFGSGETQFSSYLSGSSVTLQWGEDFDTVFKNLENIRTEVGAGEAKITLLKSRLAAVVARPHSDPKVRVLYLSRSGGTAGAGTFVDAAIHAAGGLNIAPNPGWSTPDPERLLSLKPDLILTSYFDTGYESVQATAVRHAAVREFVEARPQVNIPGTLWPCAGPGLIEAAERISDALQDFNKHKADGT